MVLTQNEVDQIINEMSNKCIVSNDGTDKKEAVDVPKTKFEKVATNLTFLIIGALVFISLLYIFPPFFTYIVVTKCYSTHTVAVIYMFMFVGVIISYILMGVKHQAYFTTGVILILILIELLYLVYSNDLLPEFNLNRLKIQYTNLFKRPMVYTTLASIVFLASANVIGHIIEDEVIMHTVFNGCMFLYVICTIITLSQDSLDCDS